MRHVERHIVKENNPIWQQIDSLCFLSKNLYNYANYLVRQSFIFDKTYLGFNQVYHLVKDKLDYQALPRKVSQQVLKVLDKNWKSFFEASKAYKENPNLFTGRPKLPKYKHKTKGRNLLIYTIQAISKPRLTKGIVKLSGTDITVTTKAKLQSQLRGIKQTSHRIQKLTAKRNNRVDTYLHQASRWIIDYLDSRGIGKLIIGQNTFWKQEVNNGKKNNQSFVFIPHARLVEMLIYKGAMKGIKVVCSEESYTSKASFLSLDSIPNYGDEGANQVKFSGYRETRGMYKIKGKKVRINADVNGSYNIMRKVIPTVFDGGIAGVVVRPIRITPGRAKIGQCYI